MFSKILDYFDMYYSNDDLVYCQKGNWHVGKGMDDTTMRDLDGECMISLDASAQKCWNFEIFYKMAAVLGQDERAAEYKRKYSILKERINNKLWNDELGIYLNRYINGKWGRHKSPTSFYPMLAGCPTEDMAERLIQHLTNEKEFWGEYVIVTLSKDDDDYGKPSRYGHTDKEYPPFSYWRGNIWPPTNYLVYEGLKRYKQDKIAAEFAGKSVALWWKNWANYNYACENYHPVTGERSPMANKHYNWSMLLPLIGIQEIIDVEGWGEYSSVRFGNVATTDKNSLYNVYILNDKYDVMCGPDYIELSRNDKVIFIARGGVITVRDFKYNTDIVEFEAKVYESVQIQIPEFSFNTKLEKGIHYIKV